MHHIPQPRSISAYAAWLRAHGMRARADALLASVRPTARLLRPKNEQSRRLGTAERKRELRRQRNLRAAIAEGGTKELT